MNFKYMAWTLVSIAIYQDIHFKFFNQEQKYDMDTMQVRKTKTQNVYTTTEKLIKIV